MPNGPEPVPPTGNGDAAAAAAMPLSRSRRGGRRLAVLAVLAAGLVMLLVALLTSANAASVGLTAAAGTFAVGVGSAGVAEVVSARLVGIVALLAGFACVLSAFLTDGFGGPELARLLAGAAMMIASAVLLPREPDVAPAVRI